MAEFRTVEKLELVMAVESECQFAVYVETLSAYLPTGLREATCSEHGRPRFNEGLRGLTKADSLAV